MFLVNKDDLLFLLRKVIKEEVGEVVDKKINRQPKILSRKEAANILGICENTISEYVKNGRLPNRGIGRKIMILDTDLDHIKLKNKSF
jgi:excisionase family DNA binding protein